MLRLTKKADYALIAVKHLAETAQRSAGACSAKDIAESYGIPSEALAKILQRLARARLLVSQHGTHGGYTLARDARQISVFEVISAVDGTPVLTSCVESHSSCSHSERCTVKEPLRKVNESIQQVLAHMSIADMRDEAAANGGDSHGARRELVTLA